MNEIVPPHGVDVRLEDLFSKCPMMYRKECVDVFELQQILLLYNTSIDIR